MQNVKKILNKMETWSSNLVKQKHKKFNNHDFFLISKHGTLMQNC